MLAPIVLFVYNRPIHSKKVLDSLAVNQEAKDSILYIFADGAKENSSQEVLDKIKKVREIVKNENRFKEIVIKESQENNGLANSIISGVTEVVEKYGQVIVLEDDLVVSDYFLDYMNRALDLYESDERVGSIAGCNFFANGKKFPESFFLPITSSWGWATWKNRWKKFKTDNSTMLDELETNGLMNKFNAYGSYPYIDMMHNQIKGKVNSWAISWHAVHILENWLCFYPNLSLVNHVESIEASHNFSNVIPPFSTQKIQIINEVEVQTKVLEAMKLGFSGKGDYFGRRKMFGIQSKLKNLVKKSIAIFE